MNTKPALAALGGCASSFFGMLAGMFLGVVIGASALGNTPVEPLSDDGQRNFLRGVQIAGNRVAKFIGGSVGLVGGGLTGAIAGSIFASYTAAKSRREEEPEDGYAKKP